MHLAYHKKDSCSNAYHNGRKQLCVLTTAIFEVRIYESEKFFQNKFACNKTQVKASVYQRYNHV